MTKTIVNIDLMAYSSIAQAIEDALAPKQVLALNDQIQNFIDQGLKAVSVSRSDAVLSNSGDGAILLFDGALEAYSFAASLQEAAKEWNAHRKDPLGRRYFRVGITTGPLEIREHHGSREFAGLVIARAVRLEAGARPGSVCIDENTYVALPSHVGETFLGPEEVPGKRDEVFTAYHRSFEVPDQQTLEAFAVQSNESPRNRADRPERMLRREVLSLLQRLRPHQYEDLVFLLMIPIDRRPPRSLPMAERRGLILEWAEEEPDGISELHESLRLLSS